MITRLFWHGGERRLRAGLRIMLQVVLMFAVIVPLTWLAGAVALALDHLPADRVSPAALALLAQHDVELAAGGNLLEDLQFAQPHERRAALE